MKWRNIFGVFALLYLILCIYFLYLVGQNNEDKELCFHKTLEGSIGFFTSLFCRFHSFDEFLFENDAKERKSSMIVMVLLGICAICLRLYFLFI